MLVSVRSVQNVWILIQSATFFLAEFRYTGFESRFILRSQT
ncbi:hypothetical protein VRK_05750 [Vibrio sp. MEBiC08052]|nr:hypothetical protein VRK_05750 [Vibrio sp. MEBiC08052]